MNPSRQTNAAQTMPSTPVQERPVDFSWWMSKHGFSERDLEQSIGPATTPLMHAARNGAYEIARELLRRGASVYRRNADGNNALWFACYSGDLCIVDMLCQFAVEVDNRNNGGVTCLMYAASTGKAELVERLLAAGADPSLRSPDDYTALDLASTSECVRLLRNARVAARPESC
jgi:ankyrin repeat protein